MWNKCGIVEAGTLRDECESVSRKGVDANVMKAYEEDKKFVNSYVTANLVVAVMTTLKWRQRLTIPPGIVQVTFQKNHTVI